MAGIKTLKHKGRGRPKGSKNKPKLDPLKKFSKSKNPYRDFKNHQPIPLVVPEKEHQEIFELSDQTKITPEQVLIDVIKTGLIAARNMYVGLIESRLALEQELENEKNSTNGDTPEHEIAPVPFHGRPSLPPMATAASPTAPSEPTNDAIGRGLEEAPDPDAQELGGGDVDAEPAPEEFPLEEEETANE